MFWAESGGLKKWLSKKNFLIFLKKYSKSEKNWWKRGELLMLMGMLEVVLELI
jgi:hypothetical protein